MNLLASVILGIVEGIAEFLPISSTAHLIIFSRFLNISQTEFQKFFEVFIQAGAILAVLLLYFRYSIKNKETLKKIFVSFLPTAVVGFFLYRIIKTVFFESFNLIIGSLIVVGLLFVIFELLVKKKKLKLDKNLNNLTFFDAVLVGSVQSLAVIPGVSRAGAVMLTMMGRGYRRDESAIYSFLLAVPTIMAASAFDLLKTDFNLLKNPENLTLLTAGFIVSFITAYISVKWLIGYLKKNSLFGFGLYRILLGLLLTILFYV